MFRKLTLAILLGALLAPLATPPAAALHTCFDVPPPCCDTHEGCIQEIEHTPSSQVCILVVCVGQGSGGFCIWVSVIQVCFGLPGRT